LIRATYGTEIESGAARTKAATDRFHFLQLWSIKFGQLRLYCHLTACFLWSLFAFSLYGPPFVFDPWVTDASLVAQAIFAAIATTNP
jgi:hypothetical protein